MIFNIQHITVRKTKKINNGNHEVNKVAKMYQKLNKMVDMMSYFTHNTWTFLSDNKCIRQWRMSDEDMKIFYWNHDINLDQYLDDFHTRIRKYLLKDPMFTLLAAKKRLKRLYYIQVITATVVGFLSLWLLWNIISLIMNTIKKIDEKFV